MKCIYNKFIYMKCTYIGHIQLYVKFIYSFIYMKFIYTQISKTSANQEKVNFKNFCKPRKVKTNNKMKKIAKYNPKSYSP